MDIHKPKPWHGLREFLKEYVIIVVGVLTALAFEQAVEWLHWRHQIEVAHDALTYDMKRVMGWSGEGDAISPCVGARLAELDAVLDKAQASGRLPALPYLERPNSGAWNLRAWAGLTYGQTLAHLPTREQTMLGALVRVTDLMTHWFDEQKAGWELLQSMSGPGRRIGDAEIATLRQTISRERGLTYDMRSAAVYSATVVAQSGLLNHPEAERAWKQGVDFASHSYLCRSIFAADPKWPTIGQALARPITPPGSGRLDSIGVVGESLK